MSYLGTFHIDDYVGIPAATHRFSSGAAYAPTALTYSIYEEATAVGLDEDMDMVVASPFDAVTGCYWVRRQLTTAAGFEAGKNYLVVVKATVDAVAAIQMHTFQIEAASVAQTGDSYAIVAHTDYGNAKLVRSTTPANTLDVSATGEAGVDLSNIKAATASTTLTNITVPTVTTVTNGVTLADDAITSAKFDETTAYPLKAADSGSTYVARTGADSDTLETLSDQLDGVEPVDVWAYATRTLTSTAAATTAAVEGDALTITVGATYDATVSGLTIPATWAAVYFTLKDDTALLDSAALVQILESSPAGASDGLLYLNGAAATAGQGSLVVTQASGTVEIVIADNATATLRKTKTKALDYDLKVLTSSGTSTVLASGKATVSLTSTRTI